MPYRKLLFLKEITWQIVGICCEMIGRNEGAYAAYVEAYTWPRVSLHYQVAVHSAEEKIKM
jgi:hypothetical protein